jgi:hypothetical protein
MIFLPELDEFNLDPEQISDCLAVKCAFKFAAKDMPKLSAQTEFENVRK